jgi:hypothetical protein
MLGEDRLTALREQPVKRVTGIDFVQVVDPADQTVLRVFFLIDPDKLSDPIVNTTDLPIHVSTDTVTIISVSGGERLAEVPVVRATYKQVPLDGETRTVLEVQTAEPGDFSIYRLTVIDEPEKLVSERKQRFDRFFNGVEFSFKQGCPSDLDCKPQALECPPEQFVDFPIDYLARDFASMRNALLDFAAHRYPDWTEKIAADAGVMLAEIMAALGDEFSYIQDRYAREAYLETATQRRSLRRHTQLVDYHIHDGLTAGTFLDLEVKQSADGGPDGGTFLNAGGRVWALGQGEPPIPFEIGAGLNDQRKTLRTLLFSVGLEFQADLDGGVFSVALRQEFADHHIFFSDTPAPELSVQDTGSRWLISHPVVAFLVAREHDTLNIYGVGRQFWVHRDWNEMVVHLPDVSKPCLPVEATELFLRGTFPTADQVPAGEDLAKFWVGKWLLLQTEPQDPAIPARRHLVRVVEVEHTTDSVYRDVEADRINPPPLAITRIKWEDAQALPFEMCLSDMAVHGNLVFATAGETITEFFSIRTNEHIPPAQAETVELALERQGPLDEIACRRSVTYLYSLKHTETQGLGWLGELHDAKPEVEIQEVEVKAAELQPLTTPQIWQWQRTLLDARGFEDVFALDDGTWRRIIGFRRIGEVIEHVDYASGAGFTIRFGDGEFGKTPHDKAVFRVRYRTGPGTKANLPADTVVNLKNPEDKTQADLASVLAAVTNPLPITSGVDPEDPAVIKQLAPEAFRAITFRAVRPEDYAEIAERLPWVQRAGARFRWTGSWLSAFVTADPLGSFELSPEHRTELANLMDCVRQAGRDVFVRNPRFVNIDLEIKICVEPFAYAGQVKARVLEALVGRKGVRPTKGFFDPDNFTFGTPLRRATLEAAIQDVAGVRGVEKMCLRARGITELREFVELTFNVGLDQVIRLQNDPRFPERGSLRIITRQEQHEVMEECQT